MKLDSIPPHIVQITAPYERNQYIWDCGDIFHIVFVYKRFKSESEVLEYIKQENADTVFWRSLEKDKYRLSALNVQDWIKKLSPPEKFSECQKLWAEFLKTHSPAAPAA